MTTQTMIHSSSSASITSISTQRRSSRASLVLRLSSTGRGSNQEEQETETKRFPNEVNFGIDEPNHLAAALTKVFIPFVEIHMEGLTRILLTTLTEAVALITIVQVVVVPAILHFLSAISIEEEYSAVIPSSTLFMTTKYVVLATLATAFFFATAKVAFPFVKLNTKYMVYSIARIVAIAVVISALFPWISLFHSYFLDDYAELSTIL